MTGSAPDLPACSATHPAYLLRCDSNETGPHQHEATVYWTDAEAAGRVLLLAMLTDPEVTLDFAARALFDAAGSEPPELAWEHLPAWTKDRWRQHASLVAGPILAALRNRASADLADAVPPGPTITVRSPDGVLLFVGRPAAGDTLRIDRQVGHPARLVADVSDLLASLGERP